MVDPGNPNGRGQVPSSGLILKTGSVATGERPGMAQHLLFALPSIGSPENLPAPAAKSLWKSGCIPAKKPDQYFSNAWKEYEPLSRLHRGKDRRKARWKIDSTGGKSSTRFKVKPFAL
jgi:hypothetical protein